MSKGDHFIALSLGSNIGDRYKNLIQGINRLKKIMRIQKISSSYLTSPLCYLKQRDFINICLIGLTRLSSTHFLEQSKTIEKENPYSKNIFQGPRGLDIDIIFYDKVNIETDDLSLPHPRFRERKFVLIPLIEIITPPIDPTNGINLSFYLKDIDKNHQNYQSIELHKKWNNNIKKWI